MQTLIQRIADKHLYRVNSNLLEDYSTNPIAPNDTSYVGFFFEKDVTQFPPKLREKYEAMKAEIDLKEAEYREKYGDDWRNIAVFNAYRGIKEEVEAVSEAKQIAANWGTGKTYDLMAESGNAESINETGMTKDVALHYAKITSLKVGNMMLFSHPELGYYTNPESDSEGAASLKKRGAKHVATASGGKLNFKMESLSEDHFSEKELTNMYSKFDKENNHDGLEAIEDYISAEADGNKAAAAKAASRLKKLVKESAEEFSPKHISSLERYFGKILSKDEFTVGSVSPRTHGKEGFTAHLMSDSGKVFGRIDFSARLHSSGKVEDIEIYDIRGQMKSKIPDSVFTNESVSEGVSEAIKGWKNAHTDIAKARSEQGKNVVLHRLKNDGTESGMATARTSFSSEEEALRRHEDMVKLNPGKKIGHNLYVDGKLIKALGESVSDSTVKMSMPLFIRLMEWAFEECKDDVQIHKLAENLSEISSVADMEDYPKLVKEELDEALQGNWSVEKIQKLKPAQIKTLTANAKAANDKTVLDMIQVATAPKIKVQAPKNDPSKKVMPVDYYRVFDSLPDLDPADVIGMVSKKYSISDEDALKGLNRLAKQDKFKDYYSAVDSALKDYRKGLGEAYGDRKYSLKKTDADKAAKAAAIERAKDKLANLRKAHAEAEDAGDDAKADSLERQIKLAQADLGNIQAHG